MQSLVGFDFALGEYVHISFQKYLKKALINLCKITNGEHSCRLYIDKEDGEEILSRIKYKDKEEDRKNMVEILGLIGIGPYFTIPRNNFDKRSYGEIIYNIACQNVEEETKQAMEALVFNFNSLHCLPASERIWVYDIKNNNFDLMRMDTLSDCFEDNRFKVVSINKNTGEAEFKFIKAIEKKDNNRTLVTITSKTGQKVTVTDNHKMIYLNNGKVSEILPNDDKYVNILSPNKISVNDHVNNKYNLLDYSKRNCIYKNNKCDISTLEINNDLAEFLGYYVADGSVKNKDDSVITFTVCDKVEENHLTKLTKKIFGDNVCVNKTYFTDSRGEQRVKSYLYSIGINATRAIKDIAGHGSFNKRVPSDILLGEKEIILSFLNAYLSCDGKKDKFNSFSTVNKKLRSQINFLIFRLGEVPYYHDRSHKNAGFSSTFNVIYEGSLGGAPSRRAGLRTENGEISFEIPSYDLSNAVKRLREEGIKWGSISENLIPRRKHHNIRQHELKQLCSYYDIEEKFLSSLNTYEIPIKAKNQSNSDDEYVYDISVEGNETFLTEDCIYVHNSRAGSQVPFSSINFGMDTSPEGRLVSKYLLEAIWNGLGKGEPAIFPISVFQIHKRINLEEGDPNYDLFQYACKVSAKRLFPNFLNTSSSFNVPYYKEGDYRTFAAAMG